MPGRRKGDNSSTRNSKRRLTQSVPADADSDFLEEPVILNEESESVARPHSMSRMMVVRVVDEKEQEKTTDEEGGDGEDQFTGDPISDDEARKRWPHRYDKLKKKTKGGEAAKNVKSKDEQEEEVIQARQHFTQAKVDGQTYNLHDDAYVKAGKDEESYICKIVEMFQAENGSRYFTAQWYYRAKDTVIGECGNLIDNKCVFFSQIKDDNPLDCLLQRLKIVHLPSNGDSGSKRNLRADCDYYYEKMYLLPYTTFKSLPPDSTAEDSETESTISSEVDGSGEIARDEADTEMSLLDIYSGCGAMSTGLCLGSNNGGVKLVTKWAVDLNQHACDSLRLNHAETQVRNESAEDFLSLLREWEKLCVSFLLVGSNAISDQHVNETSKDDSVGGNHESEEEEEGGAAVDAEVFEVEEILGICYGDPNKTSNVGLHFKIRWKGYGPYHDTWEPLCGLSDCPDKLRKFVTEGYNSKILPLRGKIDVICGGPPCQGISGFNRFRNKNNPLEDEKNKQLQVFMDIVSFLKPRFVLMENVVDIIKFKNGFLGRYAFGRLVAMDYQARMGMIAAGAYGLPQFRMRVFLWGALPGEKLPQYPLPTHNVVLRGGVPNTFEANVVAYEEGHKIDLEKKLLLYDAISDLPPVENDEKRDEIPYKGEPKTYFQHFIRLRKEAILGCLDASLEALNQVLYDHRPLQLNVEDYQRVTRIPHEKGSNFRNLAGVRVNADTNKVEWDPNVERVYLPSGKPLVPDYAMSFKHGTSLKPFGRLWWDETVPTVVTRAEPHNQVILHPVQDRVLTIRENARLQGFPDYYKLVGPVKERYTQVGNAVAVRQAQALGYCLALAFKGLVGDEPVLTLPTNFSKPVEFVT